MTLRVIILCGGAGTRFGDSVYPKPMNLVRGVPMIYHVLDSLACDHITFVYNRGLDAVGFRQYVLNTFTGRHFDFVGIDFQTRGPAETLLLGLKSLYGDEQLLVLDNDNVYNGVDLSALPSGNFVLYNNNPTGLAHYSFVKLDDDSNVAEIEERRQISDYVCVGGYGFANLNVCSDFCKQLIRDDTGESFLSQVVGRMLRSGLAVKGHHSPNVFSIGTEKDISLNSSKLTPYKLRVVFDLDNTLVTWPNIYKDYNTVKRIEHIAQFSAQLRNQGHEVVICTARNTVTCGHNVGKVLKNVGLTTLESLRQLGIEYDEIHFGKPYGDIYIDDKAFNTYDEALFRKLGFYDFQPTTCKDEFKTNKYNTITRINKAVVQKSGPALEGEIFFYKVLSAVPQLADLFPRFIQHENDTSFLMEYVNGTELSKLYFEGLLQPQALLHLLDTVHDMHKHALDDGSGVNQHDVFPHYMVKFEERAARRGDFPFADFDRVRDIIRADMESFLKSAPPLNDVIHGDLWFSNIMIYKGEFKFFDMRGKFNDKPSVKGHRVYDWAKIYQSILGLDAVINYGAPIDAKVQREAVETFWRHLVSRGFIQPDDRAIIVKLTGYLIFNTFHAYDKSFPVCRKQMIWDLVKACVATSELSLKDGAKYVAVPAGV